MGRSLQADPYFTEQLERCKLDLATLESRYAGHMIPESEYRTCQRSLQQAVREIETLIEGSLRRNGA
jgi:hypothetical protein